MSRRPNAQPGHPWRYSHAVPLGEIWILDPSRFDPSQVFRLAIPESLFRIPELDGMTPDAAWNAFFEKQSPGDLRFRRALNQGKE